MLLGKVQDDPWYFGLLGDGRRVNGSGARDDLNGQGRLLPAPSSTPSPGLRRPPRCVLISALAGNDASPLPSSELSSRPTDSRLDRTLGRSLAPFLLSTSGSFDEQARLAIQVPDVLDNQSDREAQYRGAIAKCCFCYVCKTFETRLHSCLTCIFFGCHKKNHIQEHSKIKKHYLAMELSFGNVLCLACGDYVYDSQLMRVADERLTRATALVGLRSTPFRH
ncbi:hypothetical protein LSTR_LSTR006983, partial [Laodelphax striatellus]